MRTYRGNAIAAGVLLIACSAATVLSVLPLGTMLDSPVDLAGLAANDHRVILAALVEFVGAATGAGIAVALYPVLRTHNRALALGSVAARSAGAVLILVATLSLLLLLSLGQQSAPQGVLDSSSVAPSAQLLVAVRDWVANFLGILPFLLGAGLYYYVMYQQRLAPRWLTGWGLIAVLLSLAATIYAGMTQDFGFSTGSTALNIPIGLQEIVLAVWLIAKGFTDSTQDSGAEARGKVLT